MGGWAGGWVEKRIGGGREGGREEGGGSERGRDEEIDR